MSTKNDVVTQVPSQKMTSTSTLRSGVASSKHSEDDKQNYVPAWYGKQLMDHVAALGMTPEQLAKEIDRAKNPTLDRLVQGRGSMIVARAVRRFITDRGRTIGPVPEHGEPPPLPQPEEVNSKRPEWMREWISVGERIHELATDEEFTLIRDQVRNFMDALVTIRGSRRAVMHPTSVRDRGER